MGSDLKILIKIIPKYLSDFRADFQENGSLTTLILRAATNHLIINKRTCMRYNGRKNTLLKLKGLDKIKRIALLFKDSSNIVSPEFAMPPTDILSFKKFEILET